MANIWMTKKILSRMNFKMKSPRDQILQMLIRFTRHKIKSIEREKNTYSQLAK